jgi:hypothetical protein
LYRYAAAGEIARLRNEKLPKWGRLHPKLFGADAAAAAAAAAPASEKKPSNRKASWDSKGGGKAGGKAGVGQYKLNPVYP